MSGSRHLMLVTPLFGACLVLGAAEAPQAPTLPGSAKTIAGDFSQRVGGQALMPRSDADQRRGYSDGYNVGLKDGRNSCVKLNRRVLGNDDYPHGWITGFNAGYSALCPVSTTPRST
jgi:hypothetical protein